MVIDVYCECALSILALSLCNTLTKYKYKYYIAKDDNLKHDVTAVV